MDVTQVIYYTYRSIQRPNDVYIMLAHQYVDQGCETPTRAKQNDEVFDINIKQIINQD